MRTALLVAVTAALGAVLGAGTAEVLDADLDDARRAAAAVVPPDAQVVDVDEFADFPLLPRTAFVHLAAEGATLAQLRAHLPEVEVADVRAQSFPGGTQVRGRRGQVELLVTAQPPSSLSVTATPTGPSRSLSALLGALLLPVVAAVARPARRRRGRPAPAVPQHGGPGD